MWIRMFLVLVALGMLAACAEPQPEKLLNCDPSQYGQNNPNGAICEVFF